MPGWRLRLLIDEDTQARRLVELLRGQGHDVLTVTEAGGIGAPDVVILDLAIREQRVLLTRNCADFIALHRQQPAHPGILCIYQDADPAKAMSYQVIAAALAHLMPAGVDPAGHFFALNAWQ